jgi:poly-gamma-glutamate capsule biosynthesis protein CapA/YwtB (metallophosphatase superfamily)
MRPIRLGLLGDTMLGRGVADAMVDRGARSLVSGAVAELAGEPDLLVLNLECCISTRGVPWPDPGKPFFFRAPPAAIDLLTHLGVDCVTLANNHALDFGPVALEDTLTLLDEAGIAHVGAGRDVDEARSPVHVEHGGFHLRVVAFGDHPAAFAATPDAPGIAYVAADAPLPHWVESAISAGGADAVLVGPHWGPNMTIEPVERVRQRAGSLVAAGATLVAGHSAHVFHGITEHVLYDLGDFLDDYAVDPRLRNDLGLFFIVDIDDEGPVRTEAIPIALDFAHTRIATGDEWTWVARRFGEACARLGTRVVTTGDRLAVDWRAEDGRAIP